MSTPVHVEASRDLPLVSVMLGFKIGSQFDPAGKDGLTRLMVRMLRRGVAGMDASAVERQIDRLGADLSEHVGQSTIVLQLDVIRRSFEPALELLTRILGQPTFDDKELGKLVRETEGELIESRDSDRSLCVRAFRRALFQGHPFERRTTGQIATIKTIGRGEIVDVYRQSLSAGNCVLAFSGDVDDSMVTRATELLSAALPTGPASKRSMPEPVGQSGRRLVFVDKPERTQTQVMMGRLGTHPRDPDHVAFHVANTVFGGTFTSRLMREVRSKRGWSYGAYSHLPIDICREAFSVWTHPAATDAAACIGLELSLLEAWRDKGISQSELAFAKRYLVRSHAFEIDTATKRVHRKLSVSLYDLPEDYYNGYVERVKAITRDQANDAVRERIVPGDLLVCVTGTASEIGDSVAAAIQGLQEKTTVPFDLE
jgi:zinc protease